MSSQDTPRILIIRRRYLGDIVLLGSITQALRKHWPKASLTVLAEPAYAEILTLNPDLNSIVTIPRSPLAWLRSAIRLRRSRYTHVLDLDNRRNTAILTKLTGAPHRIALHHGPEVCLPKFYTQAAIAEADFFETRHIIDYYGLVLRPLNVPATSPIPRLSPKPADLDYIRQLPEVASLPATRPKLLVHPGSRSQFRVWPVSSFAAVCDQLQEDGLASVTFVGGPGDQTTIETIRQTMQTRAEWLRQPLTSPQLAALFSHFDQLLCHDSGPMHVAAAVGTPVVALFGSQKITAWRPMGEGHITLQAPLPCTHCVAPETCIPNDSYHNYCVRNITIPEVLNALKSAPAKHRPR